MEESSHVRVGELVVASHERRAFFRDVELRLTAREFDVIEALAARPGWVFSAEQLADEFGLDGYASPSAVNVHISHLRAKLAAADAPDGFIETVRGVGWRIRRPLRAGVAFGPPFVGRDAEVRDLTELFGGGTGRYALILGDPGIGKTALAEHVIDELTPRFEVFRAVCDGNGSGDHWLWRQLLFEIEDRAGLPMAGEPDGGLLTRLFGNGSVSPSGLEGADRTLAYRAVARYLSRALAGHSRPALLFVDDLQWADDASLKLLAYLLKRLDALPFALVATSRQAELACRAGLRSATEHARQRCGSLLVELKGLRATDIGILLEEAHCDGAPESLAEVLWNCTAGNPLYINECLRALSAGVDLTHDLEKTIAPSISELVSGHIGGLPEPCRHLLRAAAVTATEFDPALVALVTGIEVSEFDPAIATGILVERGHAHLRFAHTLLREALLESLDASQRETLHSAIAAAIRQSSTTDPERRVFLLAHHYARAGSGARADAVGFLLAAARRSTARFAFEDALAHLTVALDLLGAMRMPSPLGSRTRSAILERLGANHVALSDVSAAISDYRRALEARPPEDTIARARILTRLASACARQRRRGEASSAFGDALRGLESASQRDTAWWRAWIEVLLSEAEAGFVMETPTSFDDRIDDLRAAVDRYGTTEQRAKFHCRVAGHLYAASRCSATDDCLAEQRLAVAEAMSGDSEFLRANMLGQLGGLLAFSGRLAEAESVLRQSLDLSLRCADSMGQAASLFFLAMTARLDGDVRTTESRALELQQVAQERTGMPEFTSGAEAHLGWVALRRGDLDEATAHSEHALRIWEQDPAASESVWMMAWPAASCALARGDLDRAFEYSALMTRHGQQSLKGDLDRRIKDAVAAFRTANHTAAESRLRALETEARDYGYC